MKIDLHIHTKTCSDGNLSIEEVFKEAKNRNIILEVNASPQRLDLKDTDIRKAVKVGVKLAINSDAHHKDHYEFLRYGIAQARRGWAQARDVVNTQPLKEFLVSLSKS